MLKKLKELYAYTTAISTTVTTATAKTLAHSNKFLVYAISHSHRFLSIYLFGIRFGRGVQPILLRLSSKHSALMLHAGAASAARNAVMLSGCVCVCSQRRVFT